MGSAIRPSRPLTPLAATRQINARTVGTRLERHLGGVGQRGHRLDEAGVVWLQVVVGRLRLGVGGHQLAQVVDGAPGHLVGLSVAVAHQHVLAPSWVST